jgi:aldose sugar dehydrogenase
LHWLLYLIVLVSLLGCAIFINESTYATIKECAKYQCKNPIVNDPSLKLDIVYQGADDHIKYKINESNEKNFLTSVTKMGFLGHNDILMLNKNDGKVARIVNHTLLPQPLIDLNVANNWEQGLLGVAISKNGSSKHVFLYFTESTSADGSDVCPTIYCSQPIEPIQNKLYRYDLKNDKLVNPKLLFSGPKLNVASHIGGALKIGPDNNLYIIIGDFHGHQNNMTGATSQNTKNGTFPDGRAGILRITQDGKAVGNGILGNEYPLNLYYGYGIRNGYGLDFDPVSGKLWDTENGPEFGDEINLVEPGFNGGWTKVQGMSSLWYLYHKSGKKFNPEDLLDFDGKGKYSDPKFVWNQTVAPTALTFLDSDKLGKQYENDLFVASFNLGVIYHFDLDEDRTGLKLPATVNMTSAQNEDLKELVFAQGIGKVTDMQVGPDGKLYILSKYYNKPTIFRISH